MFPERADQLRIQPDEGITLIFGAKVPGPTTNVKPVEMHFSYADVVRQELRQRL